MTNREPSDAADKDPLLLGDILDNVGQVIGAKDDPDRKRDIEATSLQDEIAGLQAERDALLETANEGNLSPESIDELSRIEDALWEARTEAIGDLGDPSAGDN